VARQEAIAGSHEEYMAVQEFGGFKDAQSGRTVPIPTPAASGESSLPRLRLPRAANRLNNITLQRAKAKDPNRRRRNRIAVDMAGKGKGRSGKFVFLELGRRSGIYRVTGRAPRPKITLIWELSRPSVAIPARPWLRPAVNKIAPYMPQYYADALRAQLVRHGILGR
jgi:hypothetical protein